MTYISIIGHGLSTILHKLDGGPVGILLPVLLPKAFLHHLLTHSLAFDQRNTEAQVTVLLLQVLSLTRNQV